MKLKWNVVLLLLLSMSLAVPLFAQDGDIAVVVNSNNSVSSLSSSELRKIYTGEKHSWQNGQAIKPFVRAQGTPEHNAVLKLAGMSEADYHKLWTSLVYRGEAQAEPVQLPSNGMQKEAIVAFPGGIAFIAAQDVRTGMKVVKIDGHLPGESGYPLHP